MANKKSFYWDPSGVPQTVEFSAKTECLYLEVLACPCKAPQRLEGMLDDSSLKIWLDEVYAPDRYPINSHKLTINHQQDTFSPLPLAKEHLSDHRCSRLRILIGTCDVNILTNKPEVSFSCNAFSLIKERLGLPDQYLTNIPRDHIMGATPFYRRENGTDIDGLIFKIPFYRQRFYQVSVSYYFNSNISYGLILHRNIADVLPPLLVELRSYQAKITPNTSLHPVQLPITAIQIQIQRIRQRIHSWDQDINGLQDVMGQHEYKDRPIGNPLEMDFTSATRKLNHISKRVGVDILNLRFLIKSLEAVENWYKDTRNGVEGDLKGIEEVTCQSMKETTGIMKDDCHSLLLLAEYEEKRMRILIQAVYQFMAQKDAKVNLELALSSATIAKASKDDSAIMRQIAIEAKRDSSAMKTIALLGMFFLPGTFVAAIFAMPVFNWDEEGMPVVSKGFGYYWAVTVPLTVLVLVSWGLAMLLPWRDWMSRFKKIAKGDNTKLAVVGP